MINLCSSAFLFIWAFLTILNIDSSSTLATMSLKEFYEVNNLNSRNVSKFNIKFNREEVESDHDSLIQEREEKYHLSNRPGPESLPIINFRNANIFTLTTLKRKNPISYQVEKARLAQLIREKPLIDERIRAKELELLLDYDTYTTCNDAIGFTQYHHHLIILNVGLRKFNLSEKLLKNLSSEQEFLNGIIPLKSSVLNQVSGLNTN